MAIDIKHTVQPLHDWYDQNRRVLPWRQTSDPYAIWVSEVMLQQTQVKTVIPYYNRFLGRFPDVPSLAGADLGEVYKLWEGLGYYSRARYLHQAAGTLAAETGGRLPDDPNRLRRLPGVGPYIAAAILSIAFQQAFAVVDGNVKRVLARLFLLDIPVNRGASYTVFQGFADGLLDRTDPGRHNQAVMELGALVCTPKNPACDICPVSFFCKAFEKNLVPQYPRREKRPALPVKRWASGVIVKNGHVLVVRRPDTGLLAGLWEFPCVPVDNPVDKTVEKEEAPKGRIEAGLRSTVGLHVSPTRRITTIRHTYTHFKLVMDVFLCSFDGGRVRLNGPAGFKWLKAERITALALHKAVHKALPAVEKALMK